MHTVALAVLVALYAFEGYTSSEDTSEQRVCIQLGKVLPLLVSESEQELSQAAESPWVCAFCVLCCCQNEGNLHFSSHNLDCDQRGCNPPKP